MNSLSKDISQIPLHCNICPKRPNFSDISHLLTHVASKGHLSNYYKMKVRGSTDHSAKKVVDMYDEWYEEWNLEELMRERMNQKERKRTGSGGRNVSQRASATSSNLSRAIPSAAPRGQKSDRLRNNMQLLDPQLGHRLGDESISRSGTPGSAYSYDGLSRTYLPAQLSQLTYGGATWGFDDDYSPTTIKQESVTSDESDDDYDDDDDYSTTARSSARRRTRPRHYPSESLASLNEDANSFDGMANDSAKLKGVLWPGMDMFDSATTEMKRKRNQKKHVSVLQSLQATSEVVEPTECVFDKTWMLRKEREITGNIESEDDLIEGEWGPEPDVEEKRRTRRRPRPALQQKHSNTGRADRSRAQSHHPPFGRDRRTPYFHGDDGDDDDLTYGQLRPSRRSGLSIHRDNTGPEITFEHPSPMNYLTSGYPSIQNTLQDHHPIPQAPNNHVPRTQPSVWGQFGASFRPTPSAVARGYGNNPFFQTTATMPAVPAMPAMPSMPAMPAPSVFSPHNLSHFTMSHQHQPTIPSSNPLFHAHSNTIANLHWDSLDMDQDFANPLGLDSAFIANAAPENPANPLFFSPTKVEGDGDSTISANSN